MTDMFKCQTTDAVNAAGFGTTQLKQNQGNFLAAATLQDGGASGKGSKEPALDTGTR